MPKIITYICDRCGAPYQLDALEEVSAYCFSGDGTITETITPIESAETLEEAFYPKVLHMEYVCPPCRQEFTEVVKEWKSKA